MEIQPVTKNDCKKVKRFYSAITANLRSNGVYQWDFFYPNPFIIKNDLKKGTLFGLYEENQLAGAVVLDPKQSSKYNDLPWEDMNGKPLIIHRLGVHPLFQGKGYGKKLVQFAESYAVKNDFTSIRFDVYAENKRALTIYEKAGYQPRGMIRFPFRSVPYQCYEKIM
ncbi:GNAT family N-acetyltransferase [Bacillus sp. BRMEA1]|uniref:GNAT family N-acetyltransferase n=1 Tax=Neobacillus endophyticus TaxID=2738405 RepID=UPI001566534B|nr:GNAT family N-acetyltransferase [Neobacillus endophyticus]NRD80387.1 GNAT family N-acetyltransferase [Neobacillus endophyticus]